MNRLLKITRIPKGLILRRFRIVVIFACFRPNPYYRLLYKLYCYKKRR